jgi:flagellar basal body rod protein FlgB
MLFGFFGRVSDAPTLRETLDESSQRVRGIAQRLSAASIRKDQQFALPPAPGAVESPTLDLQSEMTNLADEQLRYETTAKLLEKTYAAVRLSIRDH